MPFFLIWVWERDKDTIWFNGIVGNFSKPPLKKGQFVLMDYRNDHLNEEQKKEPPTFLYAMDMGNGKYFLEEIAAIFA